MNQWQWAATHYADAATIQAEALTLSIGSKWGLSAQGHFNI